MHIEVDVYLQTPTPMCFRSYLMLPSLRRHPHLSPKLWLGRNVAR